MNLRRALPEDAPKLRALAQTMGDGMGASLRSSQMLEEKLGRELWIVLEERTRFLGCLGLAVAHEGIFAYRPSGNRLKLEQCFTKALQVCCQYLLPEVRGRGWGFRLANEIGPSLIENPELPRVVFSELRGFYHQGVCPFWKALAWPFRNYTEYSKALIEGKESQVIRKLPREIDLNHEVTNMLGQYHSETHAAKLIMQSIGFAESGWFGYSSAAPILVRTF